MKEKTLIFVFSAKREEYNHFLQGASSYTYEKTVLALAEFIFEKFQLSHKWEEEYIRGLLFRKLGVSYEYYESRSGVGCIFGEYLNSGNATDIHRLNYDVFKSCVIIYNQKYDGSFQIVVYYRKDRLCELNVYSQNNEYSYSFEKSDCFEKYFDINEHRFDEICHMKDGAEVAGLLSDIFSLPFEEKSFNDFVDTAIKHKSFGVGGKYDSPNYDDEDDDSTDFPIEIVERVISGLFKTETKTKVDYSSIHILTDDVSEIKRRVADLSSHPVLPNPEKMSYREKKMLDCVYRVLGYNFCDSLVKGTAQLRRLKNRNMYCMKNEHGYSLFSDSFLTYNVRSEVNTYFSYGYMPYVMVFEFEESEMLCLKLYKNAALLGEITIFAKYSSCRNIWKNAELICSVLECDINMLKKSADRGDLFKTAYKWTGITGLPLNVSFEKISQDPELYDAQKWLTFRPYT